MDCLLWFILLILTLFNMALCSFVFLTVDDLRKKPEKAIYFTENFIYVFYLECLIYFIIVILELYELSYLGLIIYSPGIFYNLKCYMEKQHKIYSDFGKEIERILKLSFEYKVKFAYLIMCGVVCLILYIE